MRSAKTESTTHTLLLMAIRSWITKKNLDIQPWPLTRCNQSTIKSLLLTFKFSPVAVVYRANKPLAALTQDTTTLDELDALLKETDHNGFPVVVSRESQFLVGFVLRRDVILAVGELSNFIYIFKKVRLCVCIDF